MMTDRMASWLAQKTQGHVETDENGVPIMTPASVRALCLKNQGYECEEINDKLYLHFQGFKAIGGLEKYTGVKCLYLESNGIDVVSGLNHLADLRCLYLQQNLIRSIARPALEGLDRLVTLDVSGNLLQSLDGVSCLPALQTLNASKNQLSTAQATLEITLCPQLTSVDLRGNLIEEGPELLDVLANVPKLSAMYLQGNPCVRTLKHYRKAIVARFAKLTYLDERPVDVKERLLAEAWQAGGKDAEAAAREQCKAAEVEKSKAHLASWKEFRQRVSAEREAEIAAAQAAGLPAPQPKSYVSYRTVDPIEEDQRQERIRALAVAEAEAERQAVLGHGIQMMGLDFAHETAARNGATFAPGAASSASDPPVAPARETLQSNTEAASLEDDKMLAEKANELASEEAGELGPEQISKADPDEEGDERKIEGEGTSDTTGSELAASMDPEASAREALVQESLKLHYARKEEQHQVQVAEARAASASAAKPVKEDADASKDETEEAAAVADAELATEGAGIEGNVSQEEADLDLVGDCVRECLFDFTAAAALYSGKTGVAMDATQCRLAFVALQKKQHKKTSPKDCAASSAREAPATDASEKPAVALTENAHCAAPAVGRPMPKVKVQAPTQLPSCDDFEEDARNDDAGSVQEDGKEEENEGPLANMSSLGPAESLSVSAIPSSLKPGDESAQSAGEADQRDESAAAPSSPGQIFKRLTRKDILKSLHGTSDHPLNVDLCLDSEASFDDMD